MRQYDSPWVKFLRVVAWCIFVFGIIGALVAAINFVDVLQFLFGDSPIMLLIGLLVFILILSIPVIIAAAIMVFFGDGFKYIIHCTHIYTGYVCA